MSELSTIKNISFSDYESYRLWLQLGKPERFMAYSIDGGYMFSVIENNIELFIRNWGK